MRFPAKPHKSAKVALKPQRGYLLLEEDHWLSTMPGFGLCIKKEKKSIQYNLCVKAAASDWLQTVDAMLCQYNSIIALLEASILFLVKGPTKGV